MTSNTADSGATGSEGDGVLGTMSRNTVKVTQTCVQSQNACNMRWSCKHSFPMVWGQTLWSPTPHYGKKLYVLDRSVTAYYFRPRWWATCWIWREVGWDIWREVGWDIWREVGWQIWREVGWDISVCRAPDQNARCNTDTSSTPWGWPGIFLQVLTFSADFLTVPMCICMPCINTYVHVKTPKHWNIVDSSVCCLQKGSTLKMCACFALSLK